MLEKVGQICPTLVEVGQICPTFVKSGTDLPHWRQTRITRGGMGGQ